MGDNHNKQYYEIKNYLDRPTFASFLSGIAGKFGIPIWCYYVNRGQCVCSFGLQDKNNSIMEFSPAHQAYRDTSKLGFRTFLKINGRIYEPFLNPEINHKMKIGFNNLQLTEINNELGIEIIVNYYTLSNENIGALIREVSIKNLLDKKIEVEILDGMPEVIPYGVSLPSIKDMAQTTKAWMVVEDYEKNVPYFKVRASMEDNAKVTKILGGNFSFAVDENSEFLKVVINNNHIFENDTSLTYPKHFIENSIKFDNQIDLNDIPCSFFVYKKVLEDNESFKINEVFGQVENREILDKFLNKVKNINYFTEKSKENDDIISELLSGIETNTNNSIFDLYCKQTYLDNILRGGYPTILGKDKVFYLYSRKHGDIERDYNFFVMLKEPFSQGNGNFRDVNQNRRCDVIFKDFVKENNIKTFYNGIQINGYNPLGVQKITYKLNKNLISTLSNEYLKQNEEFIKIFSKEFTPGSLYNYLLNYENIKTEQLTSVFEEIINISIAEDNLDFLEGYWSDHFTYNLDLIEQYLYLYPEKLKELLTAKDYTYFASKAHILPRPKRYVETESGIRQYNFLEKFQPKSNYLLDKNENIVYSNLIEKIFLLSTIKFATLDAYGMGIELEGGKPGWYDALNGLPGILGSSMCETYETYRNIEFLIDTLSNNFDKDENIEILEEIYNLAKNLIEKIKKYNNDLKTKDLIIDYWQEVNDLRENYFETIKYNVSGLPKICKVEELINILNIYKEIINIGIEKAIKFTNNYIPSYFYYEVTDYIKDENGILPTNLQVKNMPLFLEGFVRYLKLKNTNVNSDEIYNKVLNSNLYDKKLKMYKVNESLENTTFEIGRAKSFSPGWLENESIWLHMEYKYILEMLKSKLYKQFIKDFKNVCIPFLDENVYGRSLLENSSFIASSSNPNEKIHGKGFVARLSGSTIEFINIWQIMMFGDKPFEYDKELIFKLNPTIPYYLIKEDNTISVKFLSDIEVVYKFNEKVDYIPTEYNVCSYKILLNDEELTFNTSFLTGNICEKIRNKEVKKIEVELRK